tara:strand:+ start:210 stop:782 length:573 start_codon:yes stop_codon:yes gene_type:complete
MATTILRPSSTTSQTGWASSNIHTIIGDNDSSTTVTQSATTCNFTGLLDDLAGGLSDAAINSFTMSLEGVAGRAGAATVSFALSHSSDGAFATENESFTGTSSTQTTSARTTQQDGSSALTFAYINACSIKITPNNQGITVKELYVTVDYTPAAVVAMAKVSGVTDSNIAKVDGVTNANMAKIIGITDTD